MATSLNKKTKLNSHDKLIFEGFLRREFTAEIDCFRSEAEKQRVIELCRRAFLAGMVHEQLLSE